jgi:radical SAM superfamily enzyme YgiQ (UPF0313 family)
MASLSINFKDATLELDCTATCPINPDPLGQPSRKESKEGRNMRGAAEKICVIKPDYNSFPIGLGYVLKSFEQAGIAYDFVDMTLDPGWNPGRAARSGEYFAMASAGLIGDFDFFCRLFAAIKEDVPEMPTLLGGNITWDFPTQLLFDQIPCDYIVVGEGEITGVELVRHIKANGIASTDLAGVGYRDPGNLKGFTKNPRRPPLNLSTSRIIPTWDFFDYKRYGFTAFPVLTGRGCVGRCSFCSPTNGRYRSRPMELVFEELDMLHASYDVQYVIFLNEVFYPVKEDIIAFCAAYKARGYGTPWGCLMRMDVDPAVLGPMHEAGCIRMNVGLESGSQRVLDLMHKDTSPEKNRHFLRQLKKSGIAGEVSFMTANYGEREEDIVSTIDLMLECKVQGPTAMTINYPGTLNYKRAMRRGLIRDELNYIRSLDNIYHGREYYHFITGHRCGRYHYLNLSEMPDDTLLQVVEREMRRYFTTGFHIEQVTVERASAALTLRGLCPFCATPLTFVLDEPAQAPYAMRPRCPGCGSFDAYFSPRDIEEHRAHYENIVVPALARAQRILIVGTEEDVILFFKYNHFGLDYAKVAACIAGDTLTAGFALNTPALPLEQALALEPDLVFVPRSVPWDLLLAAPELFLNRETADHDGYPRILHAAPAVKALSPIRLDALPPGPLLVAHTAAMEVSAAMLAAVAACGRSCDLLVSHSRSGQLTGHTCGETICFTDGPLNQAAFAPEDWERLASRGYVAAIYAAHTGRAEHYRNVEETLAAMGAASVLRFDKAALRLPPNDALLLEIRQPSRDPFTETSPHA